jgi:hypothetical protein
VLAKAIAAGTGQLVRGIFMCSEAYASQVPMQSVLASSEGDWRISTHDRQPDTSVSCRFSGELIYSVPRLPAARATDSAELAGAARRARSAERSTRASRGTELAPVLFRPV